MPRNGLRAGLVALTMSTIMTPDPPARGDHPSPQAQAVATADQLLALSPAQLDALYRSAAPGPIPTGKVRGVALVRPGTRLAGPASKAARLLWQGKVFRPEEGRAVNKFFGVRAVPAAVAYGPSWMDGNPSIILDYQNTSRIYARYRDEIRQVAPGLYLGIMYDRRGACPTVSMYFALETCR